MVSPAAMIVSRISRAGRSVCVGARRDCLPTRSVRIHACRRVSGFGKPSGDKSSRPISARTALRGTRLEAQGAARDVEVAAETSRLRNAGIDSRPATHKTRTPIQKLVWESLYSVTASDTADDSNPDGANPARAVGNATTAFDPDEFIRKLDKEFNVGGADDGARVGLGTQGDAVAKGNSAAVLERALDPDGGTGDLDYLQELIAIQAGGPKNVGFFGTRNMGFLHQQLVEILSYALVLTENHIFTSGATGTNAAVIRGALRAERPDLLTVILPQSVSKQPEESRELLKKVENVVELKFDALPLGEASRKCNDDILTKVQQVICFAFHDSNLLLDTCHEAKMQRKLVALFYLD